MAGAGGGGSSMAICSGPKSALFTGLPEGKGLFLVLCVYEFRAVWRLETDLSNLLF